MPDLLVSRGDGQPPHADELVKRRASPQKGAGTDRAVAAEERAVGHDDVVAERRIVGDMDAAHQHAMVSHAGRVLAAKLCRAMHRRRFAHQRVIADHQPRLLSHVQRLLQKLQMSLLPEVGRRPDLAAVTYGGRPLDDRMRMNDRPRADAD